MTCKPQIRFAILLAATLGIAATSQQDAATATITLDPVHSVALFRIRHLEAGLFWGRLKALEGDAVGGKPQ